MSKAELKSYLIIGAVCAEFRFQGIKMAVKVCKFGGTSMADADIIKSVKNIIESDGDRRFVVVSAPGKRYSGDKKITDMLFGCHKELINGGNCTKVFPPSAHVLRI